MVGIESLVSEGWSWRESERYPGYLVSMGADVRRKGGDLLKGDVLKLKTADGERKTTSRRKLFREVWPELIGSEYLQECEFRPIPGYLWAKIDGSGRVLSHMGKILRENKNGSVNLRLCGDEAVFRQESVAVLMRDIWPERYEDWFAGRQGFQREGGCACDLHELGEIVGEQWDLSSLDPSFEISTEGRVRREDTKEVLAVTEQRVYSKSSGKMVSLYSILAWDCPALFASVYLNRHDPKCLESEIWRPIAAHPGYQVSNMGRVKSEPRVYKTSDGKARYVKPKILKDQPYNKTGRRKININGKLNIIDELVLKTFMEEFWRDGVYDIEHVNRDMGDSRLENLSMIPRDRITSKDVRR